MSGDDRQMDVRALVADGATGLRPFAEGKRAALFRLPRRRILKLYKLGLPAARARDEWLCSRAAADGGLPTWPVDALIDSGGRQALVGRYVRGLSVSLVLILLPGLAPVVIRAMAALQAKLHALPFDGAVRARLNPPVQIRQFLAPVFSGDLLDRIVAAAAGAPTDRFCHGDFHGRNVVLGWRGLVILDWDRAGRGCSAADVAKTLGWLTLGTARRPSRVLLPVRAALARIYLAQYCRRSGMPRAPILAWTLVDIAKRCRETPDDPLVRRHLHRLAAAFAAAQPGPPDSAVG